MPKNNDITRLIVDYSIVDTTALPDPFSTPTISKIFNAVSSKSLFSKVELVKEYYYIDLVQNSILLTLFDMRYGQFEFLKFLFNLSIAPINFQQAVHSFIGDTPDLFIYLNDILVASENENEHMPLQNNYFLDSKITVAATFRKCELF